MIQKIYTTFISFAFAALTLSSCSDWLDLYPSDEIKEEYLFSSGDGFRTATNGIYRKMATFDLYGSNLTWGDFRCLGSVVLYRSISEHRWWNSNEKDSKS